MLRLALSSGGPRHQLSLLVLGFSTSALSEPARCEDKKGIFDIQKNKDGSIDWGKSVSQIPDLFAASAGSQVCKAVALLTQVDESW
jgi:hypothetical protein